METLVDEIFQLLKLAAELNLGDLMSRFDRLGGGSLHRMWKVETSKGRFVIKRLTLGHPERLERSEQLAEQFREEGLPAVAAIEIGGKRVHTLDDQLWIVYPFVAGEIVPLSQMQPSHFESVAHLVRDLHHCNFPVGDTARFHLYSDSHWEALLPDHPYLIDWNQRYREVIPHLGEESVLSHTDIHFMNLLWEGGEPSLLDWEWAGAINPLQERIGVAMEFAGIIEGRFDRDVFDKIMEHSGGGCKSDPESAFFGWLGTSVMGWLEFNFRRKEVERGQKTVELLMPTIAFINDHLQELLTACQSAAR